MVKILKKLSYGMEKISNIKCAVILFIIALFLGYLSIGNYIGIQKLKEISGGIGPLDMDMGYSASKAYHVIEELGTIGRQFYIEWIWLDFICALSLVLFQSVIITYIIKKMSLEVKWRKINLLPFIKVFFDYLENSLILVMLFNYPENFNVVAGIASFATIIKWISNYTAMAAIVILIILLGCKTAKRKSNRQKSFN